MSDPFIPPASTMSPVVMIDSADASVTRPFRVPST